MDDYFDYYPGYGWIVDTEKMLRDAYIKKPESEEDIVMLKLRQDPRPWVKTCRVQIYCKYETGDHTHDGHWPEVHQMLSFKGLKKYLRRKGWTLYEDETAACPSCSAALAEGADK